MITLYHGSNVTIDRIDLSKSLPDKDFGRGFYVTCLRHQAERMALSKCQRSGGSPVVTVFEFDDGQVKKLKLKMKVFDKPSEAWAKFVLGNRHASRTGFSHPFDIVIGPVANDAVATQLRLYEMDYISLRQLVRKLTFNQLNSQHFFATDRAISLLRKTGVYFL